MKFDSLDELESAFAAWRRRKKHARERIPEALLVRAQRTAEKHGVGATVRVTRVERARLFRTESGSTAGEVAESTAPKDLPVPAFSRLELSAPSAPRLSPIAELETGTGVTLRMFEQTPEMMGLLAAVCGLGGGR